jgi:hypothetical protein
MPSSKTQGRMSQQPRRSFAESAGFPRWIVAVGVLLVGFILWLAAFSDASGKVGMPGPGSVIYLASVLGVVAFLIYFGHSRRAGGRGRR